MFILHFFHFMAFSFLAYLHSRLISLTPFYFILFCLSLIKAIELTYFWFIFFIFFLLVRQASSSTSPFSRSLSYELHELKKKRKLADRRAYKQQCNLARNLTKTKGNP